MGVIAETTQATAFHVGLTLSAFGFGLRHGIDWDHIAALTDLASGQTTRRRSLAYASLYAFGHALVVGLLGVLAIVAAEQLPTGVDTVMERFVGATLVGLGLYVVYGLARYRRGFRMRSRWMLLITMARSISRRLRPQTLVEVVHDHPHPVTEVHDHQHRPEYAAAAAPPATLGGAGGRVELAPPLHSHPHRHRGHLPTDPFVNHGGTTAFGVGMLHGVGAETPTQVLVFLAAAGAGGPAKGVLLLACFIVGLLCSNSAIALIATFGQIRPDRHFNLYVAISVITAAFSLVIGLLFLLGRSSVLPALFGG